MRTALIVLTLSVAVALAPPAAWAGSIAYIDNGEVWVASLDGAQKVRIGAPNVTLAGETETYNAVAAADGGRIVAARNKPGRVSTYSSFKAWEPNGTSTVEGPLNSRPGGFSYAYPLGFDLTPDGTTMVYGFSSSTFNSLTTGTYVRPVTNSPLEPIQIAGEEDPTLFGTRVIAHNHSMIDVQDPATPYGSNFAQWVDTAGIGLDVRRTDVAANGQLVAYEAEQWQGGTQTIGKIGLLSVQGVDQYPIVPAAVDCYLSAAGVATDVSLSQDGRQIAWTDAQGLKVAPTPTGVDEFCVFSSAPVVISPTGKSASIGGANIAAFLPPPPPPPVGPPVTTTPPIVDLGLPLVAVPSKVTTKALRAGLPLTVKVPVAGKVTISATVPAKALGRKGKPVVVATGTGVAKAAGKLTIKLRLNAAGRKKIKRLKGARLTLKIAQGGRTTTKTVTLR
jgi:hypothetical protein